MIGGPKPLFSRLSRFVPERMDAEKEKRNGWSNHGILVVAIEDTRLGWPEREMVKHLANKIFGHQTRKEMAHGR